MELDDIRALVEVVNAGGFVKAASRLGVSKSIVSRRIARLEAELGTRLLHRNTRGIGPTDAGSDLAARGERILSDVADARDAVAGHHSEMVGRFRIALPLSFGIRHMTPVLAKLHAEHPRLEIDVCYSDTAVDLLAGRFDAAVRIGRLKGSTLVARRIAPVSLIVVASPAYVERHGAPVRPADLAKHKCLIYSGPPQRQTWQFRVGKKRVTVSPDGLFHSDNGEGLVGAAEAGIGIAALPDFIVSDGLRTGRLVRLLEDFPLQEGAVYVVRPPSRTVPAKVRVLTDVMVAHFGA
jgi:DNA-binding transcriptional LysR family regulator